MAILVETGKMIGRPRKHTTEEARKRADADRRYQNRLKTREFVGVDGEGGKDADGNDYYTLLRVGEHELRATGERLTTRECLEFLFANHRRGVFYVGFSLVYDVDHILRDLTATEFHATRSRRVKVRFGEFTYYIRRYRRKYLEVTQFKTKVNSKGRMIKLFDTFAFFQCSFLEALKRWKVGTVEELALIERMKNLRANFADVDPAEISRYNKLECDLLQRLMVLLDQTLQQLGLKLSMWHGPGAAAKAMMKKHGICEEIERWKLALPSLDAGLVDALNKGFFGGRFQQLWLGIFEDVKSNDICSAYPHILRSLPHLGGTWRRVEEYDPVARWALWHVRWNVEGHQYACLPPFPYRMPSGAIHYPHHGQGWYYQDEVAAAIELFGAKVKVLGGWVYEPPCEGSPFSPWVEELYEERLKLGKAAKGLAIKLILNSSYGVTAQRPLDHEHEPPFRCPLWAGLITSGTRAQILRAGAQAPLEVLMIATDGIVTARTLNLPISKALGEWEEETVRRVEAYQPGVYRLTLADGTVKARARGVPDRFLNWEMLERIWLEDGHSGEATVQLGERFVSRDLAIHENRPERAFRWVECEKSVKLQPGTGRPWLTDYQDQILRWHTYLEGYDYYQDSTPYAHGLEVPGVLRELQDAADGFLSE